MIPAFLVLVALGVAFWVRRAPNPDVLCCPRCKKRFSDWFVTHQDGPHKGPLVRYCYPCSGFNRLKDGSQGAFTEKDGIWIKQSGDNA